MRRSIPLLALALLTLPLLAAPAATGQSTPANCSYYFPTDVPLPGGFSVRLLRYNCTGDFGYVKVAHRADIVRVGEPPNDRVLAQLEMHSIHSRYATGAETREVAVVLKDVSSLVRYSEVEYRDSTATGACSGATTLYYGAQTSPLLSSGVPCLPVTLLMP